MNDVITGSDGSKFLVISKKKSVDILTLGRAVQLGVGWGLAGGDVGTVSIVKIVSLSPRVENLTSRSL